MPPTANGSFPLSLIVKFLKCASETSGKEYAHLLFGALSNSFYVRNKTIKTKTQKLMEFKFVLLWNFLNFGCSFGYAFSTQLSRGVLNIKQSTTFFLLQNFSDLHWALASTAAAVIAAVGVWLRDKFSLGRSRRLAFHSTLELKDESLKLC